MTEISREYAMALFSLAKEENKVREIYESLISVKDIFNAQPEYVMFLASPGIPKKERINALNDALSGYEEYVCSFVSLLTENGYISMLSDCVDEYELLYQTDVKTVKAYVSSAVELTDEQKNRLKEKLQKKSGREVELVCTVDESLMAGITVNMDETVIDGSLKRRLHNLKDVMEK